MIAVFIMIATGTANLACEWCYL